MSYGYREVLEGSAVARYLGRRDRIGREIAILMQRLEDLRLLAPADGVVVTPKLEDRVGSYLEVGEAFCEVNGLDGFHARMPIREAQLDRVRPGQEVDLILIAYPFRTFRGRVAALAPVSRDGEGLEGEDPGIPEFTEFDVIVEIEESTEGIKSGMGGKARIRVGRATIAGRVGRAFQRWVGSRVW